MAMGIQIGQDVMGEQVVDDLGFLQAQNIRRELAGESLHQGRA
jgi:hypothetical protein